MATILKSKSIYYNDVNLIARPSVITSRSKIPKELYRIIVSPMEAVIGETFAKEADRIGISMCLHRFCKVEQQLQIYHSLHNKDNVFVSIGLNDWDRAKELINNKINNFLIDIANGYLPNIRESVYKLKELGEIKKIMLGNIMTDTGFYNLSNMAEETYIRVGIAGGSACSTSDVSGYNRGQITELIEVEKLKDNMGSTSTCKENYIVADGGIKNGNYASKAFGCGADFVMLGGYFANAIEAETNIIGDGTYWGGASTKQQERWGGIKNHSEGKIININKESKSLQTLVDDLWGGITTAISYSGYSTLSSFIGNGVFEIKENSLPPKS